MKLPPALGLPHRPRFRSVVRIAAASLACGAVAAVTPACAQKKLPGVAIGQYKITGMQSANTCWAADDTARWDATFINVSRDGDTLYWYWLDGSAPIAVALDGTGAGALPADVTGKTLLPDGGATACSMKQTQVLTFAFGTAQVPLSFPVSVTDTLSVVDGTDCSSQLKSGGGPYATLPCAVSYDLTATLY